jgi:hemolysin activation/secretion protein
MNMDPEKNSDVRIQPLATPIPLSDRFKAIGLMSLAGALGAGALWGGRMIWNSSEDVLAPLPEVGSQQTPLRDRMRVIKSSAVPSRSMKSSSLQAMASTANQNQNQNQNKASAESRQETDPTATHISRGSTKGSSQGSTKGSTSSQDSDDFENDDEQAMPIESSPVEDTIPDAVASVPPGAKAAPSSPQSATKTAAKATSKATPKPSFPIALIAALLQAPTSNGDRTTDNVATDNGTPNNNVAIVPRSPARPTPVENQEIQPERSIPTPAPTPVPSPAPSSVPVPAPTPTPSPVPSRPVQPTASTPPTTSETAAPPVVAIRSAPLKESIYIDRLNVTNGNANSSTDINPSSSPNSSTNLALKDLPADRLTISGNTRFSSTELATVVQEAISANGKVPAGDPTVINRNLSPAELVKASEAITTLYTKKGYITSGAYVPAEVLTGSPPEIRVVEGKLEPIQVTVKPLNFLGFGQNLSEKYVRDRLARWIRLPLDINQLADAVKLLEQDPLISSITTELSPGTTTGRSVLKVFVNQAPPLRITGTLDNGRSPSVGRLRQLISLSQANLLGMGDRFQVGFNRSAGSQGWDLSYAIPVNANNGLLSFLYSNNRGQVVEEPFQDLDIKSRSQSYEISFRQPLLQTANEEFALSLRGTHYRNEGVFLETLNGGTAIPFPARGSDLDGITKITALRFGQSWVKRGERDVFSLQSEFNLGLTALGATQQDQSPDGRFFSWQGKGLWVHSFAPDTLLSLKGQLQFADRPLLSVEQISLGGVDTVRGYRTGVLLADNGLLASAEMYLPVLRIPEWRSVVQIIPFFDFARGWNRGDEQPSPGQLASTGLGLQWKVGDNFRARLDWGIPLMNKTAGNGQSLQENLFFSIQFSP